MYGNNLKHKIERHVQCTVVFILKRYTCNYRRAKAINLACFDAHYQKTCDLTFTHIHAHVIHVLHVQCVYAFTFSKRCPESSQ